MIKFGDNNKYKENIFRESKSDMDPEQITEKVNKKNFFTFLKNNIYLVFGLVLFLLMILGYVFNNDWSSKRNNSKKDISELKPEYYVNLKDIMVSLSDSGGKKSYLKLSMSIHLSEDYDVKQVESKLPIIKDAIQIFLKDLRVSDFNYPGVILKIKEELTKRINKSVSPVEIRDVLIQDIFVN